LNYLPLGEFRQIWERKFEKKMKKYGGRDERDRKKDRYDKQSLPHIKTNIYIVREKIY